MLSLMKGVCDFIVSKPAPKAEIDYLPVCHFTSELITKDSISAP